MIKYSCDRCMDDEKEENLTIVKFLPFFQTLSNPNIEFHICNKCKEKLKYFIMKG